MAAERGIAQRRLYAQRLWGSGFATADEVVAWLVAMQAQEFPVAKWSVAQRAPGVTNAAVDQAFADGTILRTHILRPTWHFVTPGDLRWLLALSAPRVHALNASYYRKEELDAALLAKSESALARALQGQHLTRAEVAVALDRTGVTATGIRLAYILMHAELEAVICSGAPRGKQQTYASFDERVPPAPARDRDESLAELTARYFRSRGPATVKDFARWCSLTLGDARAGLELVQSQVEHEVVDGRTYWFAPSPEIAGPTSPVVDLVQGYDECIMSYGESKDVLREPAAGGDPIVPFDHAVLLDGHVIGHWRHVPKSKVPTIETSVYRTLDPRETRALDDAIERYGAFLGVTVSRIS
jgi:hypothetical protein